MSFDWSGGRGGQPGRPGGRDAGRRGRPPQPLELAREGRAAMQEQFYRVDQAQNDLRDTVATYSRLLPDRAARTGVVPGFEALDEQANALILEYLGLLDRFDPLEERVLAELHEANQRFAELIPKLGRLADDFDQYVDRFAPELTRVGEAKETVQRRVAAANAKVDEAERAWRRMGEEGYEFAVADRAIAQARIAARKLAGVADRLTPDKVDEPAKVVEKLAAEALSLAVDLPRRAGALRSRIPSLATRIDALQTRAESVPQSMQALRREFSLGNWQDLADREKDIARLLEDARKRLSELRHLHQAGDTSGALAQLDLLEHDLRSAGDVIDGPRERLAVLRETKANPQGLFDRTRFSLRDARYLILQGRTEAPQPWAGRLDSAARELIALESLLEGSHPDYWALHQRMEALQQRIRQLVDDFRSA